MRKWIHIKTNKTVQGHRDSMWCRQNLNLGLPNSEVILLPEYQAVFQILIHLAIISILFFIPALAGGFHCATREVPVVIYIYIFFSPMFLMGLISQFLQSLRGKNNKTVIGQRKEKWWWCLGFYFSLFLVALSGMWDLGSLTRDWAYAPWIGSIEF